MKLHLKSKGSFCLIGSPFSPAPWKSNWNRERPDKFFVRKRKGATKIGLGKFSLVVVQSPFELDHFLITK